MWQILFFLFDFHSELSPTHPQSDMCDSPNQSEQCYFFFFLVGGLRKKDFYNINVFLFQGVISSEPLFFTITVSFCNGL